MSYDELPTESNAPRVTEDAASTTTPGTSATDAPPTTPRQRRGKATGSDAASSTGTPILSQPTRATRARRKTTTPEAPPPEAGKATSTGMALPEAPSPQNQEKARKPARRSKTIVTVQESTSSAEPPPPVEVKAEVVPVAVLPTPSQRRPRSRKPEAAPKSEATPLETPPVTVEASPPPVATTEGDSRRRPSRPRTKRGTATEVIVPTEAIAEPPVSPAIVTAEAAPKTATNPRNRRGQKPKPPAVVMEVAPEPITPPEAVAKPETEASEETERGGRNRRRPARSRRRPTTETAQETAETPKVQESTTDPETVSTEGEGKDVLGNRARRNRRGDRTRRGEPIAARQPAGVEETAETVVAPPPHRRPVVAPEPKIDLSIGAHLIVRNGLPEITIQGKVYPPMLFFGNMEAGNRLRVLSEVKRAAKAGVHIHSTLIEIPCPLSEASDALDEIDNILRAVLDADPDGYLIPRIVFVPARGWRREYPTEMATYTDGPGADPSLTSERFWLEAERTLTALISHFQSSEWGKHICGYHLERGEWFQPADQGYDRSTANRDAFRDWLREKYKHNLVTLRAAWYNGDVQFHTAEIPPLVAKPNQQQAFFETRRERSFIDFYEFTSESTAKRLIGLGNTIKKASEHQALVSVCYGYTFEFGHPFSGHLALAQLLESPVIDLICGPPSYRDRKPGGAASFPAPVESVTLHGKLWLSEDDTKTYLAPPPTPDDDFNPRLGDKFATEQAHARAMGKALAHSTGIGWMDLWGEGWLDDEAVWEKLGTFTDHYATLLKQREQTRIPEVIVLIDEKSLLHIQKGETFFRKLTNGLRDTLQRAGVSYGTYLQSDLLSPDLPMEAKLYLFLTPYRLTTEQRNAVKERLQKDDKTLAFLYAPGACEEHPAQGVGVEEAVTGVVGIALQQQAWNSEIGSRVIETDHPLTTGWASREIGTRERLNPSFYVDDPLAKVLAEYQGSGLPSLAVRDMGGWKSVFVGDPGLPLEMLRGICRYAGVHLWTTSGDDIIALGNGWVTIHSTKEGQRTLNLPVSTSLYDLTDRRLVAEETREYKFFLRAGTTKTFFVGPTGLLQKLDLPNLTLATTKGRVIPEPLPFAAPNPFTREEKPETPETGGKPEPQPKPERPARPERRPWGRRRDTLLPVVTPSSDVPEPPSSALRADLETLEAILKMDISAMEEIEDTELEAPEDDALDMELDASLDQEEDQEEFLSNGRRRRRRGGRGRGRKRTGSISEDKEEDFLPDAPATASIPEPPPVRSLRDIFPPFYEDEE